MLLAITVISCSKENEVLQPETNSNENSMKSSIDMSALYLEIIENHFTNPESFDELSIETKINLYEYKYDKFIDENDLTSNQIAAVNGLKTYIQELEFNEERELSNSEVAAVWSNFEFEQGVFLLTHLGNSEGDYNNPPNQVECWWCWEQDGVVQPCHEEFRGGESIGFYQTVRIIRRGAFGIRNRSRDYLALAPCD